MKANNKIQPFDNLLANYIVQEDKEVLSVAGQSEAETIFNKKFETKLSVDKVKTLLSALQENLSKDTLGSLVTNALVSESPSESELQQKTGLTPSLIDAIKLDMVFTNSIPVKSLVKLIKTLNLSIEKVQEAINNTFDKLSVESKLFLTVPTNALPSFRKGTSRHDLALDYKKMKSDESYLYQNKESLEKYTNRLIELYKEN